MSGGSFDYLCYKSAIEVLANKDDLKYMCEYLKKHGKHDIADTIERLYFDIEMFERIIDKRLKRLHDVLWAVEWWADGDIDEKKLDKVWKDFLERKEEA